jgi:ankyrin repeat protein
MKLMLALGVGALLAVAAAALPRDQASATLRAAVARGDVTAIGEALRGGANVESRDAHGLTPLMLAAERGDAAAAALLLDAGADPLATLPPYTITAATLAGRHGADSEIARLLTRAAAGRQPPASRPLRVQVEDVDSRPRR